MTVPVRRHPRLRAPAASSLVHHKWLSVVYLLLHTTLCSLQLYLLVESLSESHISNRILISLFIAANLLFALLMLSRQISLRLIWAILCLFLLYLIIQSLSDFIAGHRADPGQVIVILYNILQARMSMALASLFLISSALMLRFGKYRSIEAVVLLPLSFYLLTRDELSISFENHYNLYRLLCLLLPALNLMLLGLSLNPYLRCESSWISPVFRREKSQSASALRRTNLIKHGKQFGRFAALILFLFALLYWTPISPINWHHPSRGSQTGNGLLRKNLNNQFDFGQYLQLDSSLEQDRQLVMMSQIEDLAENRPSYLTRFSLSGLDSKRSFFRDPQELYMPGESSLPLELERGTSTFQMPQYDLRHSQQADIFLLNIKPSSLFVLNYPTEVQTFENWPDSSFSRVYHVKARTLVDSYHIAPPPGAKLERYSQVLPAEQLAYYTHLPKEYHDIGDFTIRLLPQIMTQTMTRTMPRIRHAELLALSPEQLRNEWLPRLSPLQIAAGIVDYFQTEYRYTLKPGIAEDGDQLRYFLFDSKKGYCTYFAFSAGLMLRSLGIPTRVVVGFLLNPGLRILDYYPLFADQAHAWIEVFEPRQGWITFDPTTFELAPGEQLEFGLPEGAEADLAALTEELLRNGSLRAESGLNKLLAETTASQQLLSQLLDSLRQRSWLLPGTLIIILAILLLLFRTRLLHLALSPPSTTNEQKMSRQVYAQYHYLQLLNRSLFAAIKTKLPFQLFAWQDALRDILKNDIGSEKVVGTLTRSPEAKTLKSIRCKIEELHTLRQLSEAALPLLQKYYYGPYFVATDLTHLQKLLLQIPPQLRRRAHWQPLWLLRCGYLYYFSPSRRSLRHWHPPAKKSNS